MAEADRLKRRVELLPVAGQRLSANCCVDGNGTISSSENEEFSEFSLGWWLRIMLGEDVASAQSGQSKNLECVS